MYVYFPIEEKVNNTYFTTDKFYNPKEKEKSCQLLEGAFSSEIFESEKIVASTKFYLQSTSNAGRSENAKSISTSLKNLKRLGSPKINKLKQIP